MRSKAKKEVNKVVVLIPICILLAVSILFSVDAATAGFTNQQQLKFTGTSSSPGTLYQDAIGTNVDVGIEVCDTPPVATYVGGFYALRKGASNWEYSLATYSTGGSNALALTSWDGSCYTATPASVTVSPSSFTTPNPDVYRAALPGRLWIGYAGSSNPGDNFGDNFIYANESAELRGSYDVTRSYTNQATGIVSITPTQITFISDAGTFSKNAGDGSFGIDADRPALLGICSDDYGYDCNDGTTSTSAAPALLASGITNPNDQFTYTRYSVINGLGYEMCIGPNLDATISTITPDPIYYSQTLDITFVVENPRDTPTELYGGNVDVTTDFDVNIRIYNSTGDEVYSVTRVISETIVPDGSSTPRTVEWLAIGHSGQYRVEVEADSGDNVEECYNVDNTAISYFDLLPITLPEVYIDGVETNDFTYPNIPYNLTMVLQNSDEDVLSDSNVIIQETNGLSLTAPTQIYNRTIGGGGNEKSGVVVTTNVNLVANANGRISLAFIPTYNKFYLAQYNYTDLDEYIGNYSLSFTGNQSDGEDFMFIFDGENVTTDYPFDLLITNYTGTYAHKNVPNEDMISQALDFSYHTFVNFLDVIWR
ncbi:MAG: hypothetical protein KAQ83_01140 [Nanoarchaeota archaeon]|nr:hypothetical protein [Nanoarchaeota archaeon]